MAQQLVKMFDYMRTEYDPNDQCKDLQEFIHLLPNCATEDDLEELVDEYFYGSWYLKYSNNDQMASIFEQVIDRRGEETTYDNSGYTLEIIWR